MLPYQLGHPNTKLLRGCDYMKVLGEQKLRELCFRVHNGERTFVVCRDAGISRETLLKYVKKFGCKHGKKGTQHRDLTGQKFSRLTAIKQVPAPESVKNKEPYYLCQCECGKKTIVRSASLRQGNTRSCGCLQVEHCKGFRMPAIEAARSLIYSRYKTQANERGYDFQIGMELFISLIEGNCWYCGSPPSNKTKRSPEYRYSGIDRVDNEKQYVFGNVVTCCRACNVSKSVYSAEDFIKRSNAVAKLHPRP